jgi:hypothetical protein
VVFGPGAALLDDDVDDDAHAGEKAATASAMNGVGLIEGETGTGSGRGERETGNGNAGTR